MAERRQYKFKAYTPEKRSGKERQSGNDRRRVQNTRDGKAVEQKEIFRFR